MEALLINTGIACYELMFLVHANRQTVGQLVLLNSVLPTTFVTGGGIKTFCSACINRQIHLRAVFSFAQRSNGIDIDGKIILLISRLFPEKNNPDLFIRHVDGCDLGYGRIFLIVLVVHAKEV